MVKAADVTSAIEVGVFKLAALTVDTVVTAVTVASVCDAASDTFNGFCWPVDLTPSINTGKLGKLSTET